MPGATSAVTRRPNVLFRDLGGESVLLDRERGTYFGLNEVGTAIWKLAAEAPSLGSIHDALVRSYDADPDRVWRDLVEVVNEMESHGLVEVYRP